MAISGQAQEFHQAQKRSWSAMTQSFRSSCQCKSQRSVQLPALIFQDSFPTSRLLSRVEACATSRSTSPSASECTCPFRGGHLLRHNLPLAYIKQFVGIILEPLFRSDRRLMPKVVVGLAWFVSEQSYAIGDMPPKLVLALSNQ